MMSPMLSREGLAKTNNTGNEWVTWSRKFSNATQICQPTIGPSSPAKLEMHLKTLAQMLEKQCLGSIWNRSVAWAAKNEKTCEKLRKYMYFAIEPPKQNFAKKFAKSLREALPFAKFSKFFHEYC